MLQVIDLAHRNRLRHPDAQTTEALLALLEGEARLH
jgi:hypothetical protein